MAIEVGASRSVGHLGEPCPLCGQHQVRYQALLPKMVQGQPLRSTEYAICKPCHDAQWLERYGPDVPKPTANDWPLIASGLLQPEGEADAQPPDLAWEAARDLVRQARARRLDVADIVAHLQREGAL